MPENEDKVFDVTKPQHITPNASAKPIIVGHRPTMADPMVRPAEKTESISTVDHLTQSPSVQEPPIENAPPENTPIESTPPSPIGNLPMTDADKETVQPQTETASEPVSVPPLPLGHSNDAGSGQRKNTKWLLAAILLVLIGLYLAIDSGLIGGSINLPIHIFKQNKTSNNNTDSAPPAASSTPPTAAQPTIPAGFNQYKDSSIPFTFDYPTAWGMPTATTETGFSKRGGTNKSDGTYAVTINFATNKDVQIVTTSGKYLPVARPSLYYDFGQWCIGSSDGKIYKSLMRFTSAGGVDSATTMVCDQGPLTDATKLTSAIIVQPKTKDANAKVIGDVYTANLSSVVFPVLRVKDALMTNGTDIKTLLGTIH